jgi:hypothetical protein
MSIHYTPCGSILLKDNFYKKFRENMANTKFIDNIYVVNGKIGINNNAPAEDLDITGSINVSDNLFVGKTSEFLNDVLVSGVIKTKKDMNIGGTAVISGDAQFSGGLTVGSGNINNTVDTVIGLTPDNTTNAKSTIFGDIILGSMKNTIPTTVNVVGNMNNKGNSVFNNSVTINGNTTITGDTTLGTSTSVNKINGTTIINGVLNLKETKINGPINNFEDNSKPGLSDVSDAELTPAKYMSLGPGMYSEFRIADLSIPTQPRLISPNQIPNNPDSIIEQVLVQTFVPIPSNISTAKVTPSYVKQIIHTNNGPWYRVPSSSMNLSWMSGSALNNTKMNGEPLVAPTNNQKLLDKEILDLKTLLNTEIVKTALPQIQNISGCDETEVYICNPKKNK